MFDGDPVIRKLSTEIERAHSRNAELLSEASELAAALRRVMAENERLRAALKPFAEIGLDVLKEHPGWANHVFSGMWCGYRLTYTQFETAAAAAIRHEQSALRQSGDGNG